MEKEDGAAFQVHHPGTRLLVSPELSGVLEANRNPQSLSKQTGSQGTATSGMLRSTPGMVSLTWHVYKKGPGCQCTRGLRGPSQASGDVSEVGPRSQSECSRCECVCECACARVVGGGGDGV